VAARRTSGLGVDTVKHRGHLVEVFLGLLELPASLDIRGLAELLNGTLEGLVVVVPRHVVLLPSVHGFIGSVIDRRHGLGGLAAAAGRARGLALPSGLGLILSSALGSGAGTSAMVVVDTPHVVLKVPGPGESLTLEGAFASLVSAVVSLVAVHPVGLALMSEKAGGGREAGFSARLYLAAVGPKVRVDEFAVEEAAKVSTPAAKALF